MNKIPCGSGLRTGTDAGLFPNEPVVSYQPTAPPVYTIKTSLFGTLQSDMTPDGFLKKGACWEIHTHWVNIDMFNPVGLLEINIKYDSRQEDGNGSA